MEISEWYLTSDRAKRRQEPIGEMELEDCFAAIKSAYGQAGLDPMERPKRSCPGFRTEQGIFQISLSQMPDGEILGAHYLATNPDETYVNEADIFMWTNQFNSTSGRLRHPANRYLVDYRLDDQTITTLTSFINEHVAEGHFIPMEERHILGLAQ
jgi:hypothetical protein